MHDDTAIPGTARAPQSSDSHMLALVREMRPHQWAKNLLVFVPLLTARRLTDPSALAAASAAFLAFSLAASALYVMNDLLDLSDDRRHPTKRHRPLASGRLSVRAGVMLAIALFLLAAVVTATLPQLFAGLLALYLVTTTLYSTWFKRRLMVDVLCLAGLYTLRLLAGGAATDTTISPWLLAFSVFFFLSMAFAKRYTELAGLPEGGEKLPGRGYWAADLQTILSVGPASGYISVLVLCLYINSEDVRRLYERPWVLWLACPVLLYWISRVWFLAHRQQLPYDPIVFALRDRISYLAGAVVAALLLAA